MYNRRIKGVTSSVLHSRKGAGRKIHRFSYSDYGSLREELDALIEERKRITKRIKEIESLLGISSNGWIGSSNHDGTTLFNGYSHWDGTTSVRGRKKW